MKSLRSTLTVAFLVIIAIFSLVNLTVLGMHLIVVNDYKAISDNMIAEYKLTKILSDLISSYNAFVKQGSLEARITYDSNVKQIYTTFNQLDKVITDRQSRANFEGLKNTTFSVIEETSNGVQSVLSGDISGTSLHYDEANRKYLFAKDSATSLILNELNSAEKFAIGVQQFYIISFVVLVAIVLVVFLMSIILAINFSKKITRPIIRLTDLAGSIARGVLSINVEKDLLKEESEIGILSNSFNEMLLSLKSNINGLHKAKVDLEYKNKELESLNKTLAALRLKEEFLHLINHQLRTPVSAIRGYLEFWRTGTYKKFTPEKQEEIKNNIIIASDQLASIVNGMVDALELEASGKKIQMNIEKVDVKKLIENIYSTDFKKVFIEKNLEFNLVAEDNFIIETDEKYLINIISNLIDNAAKYTLKGGVEVRLSYLGEKIVIEIKDSGIGLSVEDRARLFQRFVRSEAAAKIIPSGSGLGLYIVKKMVDLLQGRIYVASEGKDKGATFIVELPIKLINK